MGFELRVERMKTSGNQGGGSQPELLRHHGARAFGLGQLELVLVKRDECFGFGFQGGGDVPDEGRAGAGVCP